MVFGVLRLTDAENIKYLVDSEWRICAWERLNHRCLKFREPCPLIEGFYVDDSGNERFSLDNMRDYVSKGVLLSRGHDIVIKEPNTQTRKRVESFEILEGNLDEYICHAKTRELAK